MTDAAGARRPNFVVVLTDDQGPWATPWEMPELRMPRLQALAAESLRFDRFYTASPVCSPARASLLTGRIPSAHGVHDWLVGERSPDAFPDRFLDGQPTTPEALARAGYQCWLSGKWHVGDSRWPAPGFEGWYAHRFGGGPYVYAPVWRDGEPVDEPRYLTEAITDEALAFIADRDPERPFYLQVNYTAPHDPWLEGHPEQYTSLYAGCEFASVPREERHPWTRGHDHFDGAYRDPVPRLIGYCASLTGVDDGLGRLLDHLEEAGLRDDTVVVFLSDNGFSCGHHGVWGKGNGTWPLNFWDNSVRVPFLVSVPGGPRGTTGELASALALHATICDLAGVTVPPDLWRAAGSLGPLLRGEQFQGPDAVVVASEYGGGRMVTDGRWVYVERHDGPTELYDHADDPEERRNLAASGEADAELARLRDALRAWFQGRERAGVSAWERDVRGLGQVHPVWRGRTDAETYASVAGPDGTADDGAE